MIQLIVLADSQGAINCAQREIFNHHTKPIHKCFHHTRQTIDSSVLKLGYRRTNDMVFDTLTKSLGRVNSIELNSAHELQTK